MSISWYQFRVLSSSFLSLFFGYFAPCLNTVKAILDHNQHAVKEYLTYWVVYLLSVYLSRILQVLSIVNVNHKHYPPELKVLFILWLTLPRFKGALRIYLYVIQPYFEKYEEDIDESIANVTKEMKSRATRQVRGIVYQLFFAPNDGMLTAAVSGMNTLIGNKQEFVWPEFLGIGNNNNNNNVHNNNGDVGDDKSSGSINLSSAALSRHLINEFSSLLREGMYLEVWQSVNDIDNIFPCELQLVNYDKIIGISISRGDDNNNEINNEAAQERKNPELTEELEDNNIKSNRDSIIMTTRRSFVLGSSESGDNLEAQRRESRRRSFTASRILTRTNVAGDNTALKVPLMLVSDVSADCEQSLVVSVSIPVDILAPEAYFAFAGLFGRGESGSNLSSIDDHSIENVDASQRGSVSGIPLCRHVALSLLAEGVEEAEALQVGLQLLVQGAKTQAIRTLRKALRNGRVPRAAMATAFKRWVESISYSDRETESPFSPDLSNSSLNYLSQEIEADDPFNAGNENEFESQAQVVKGSLHVASSHTGDEDSDDDYGIVEADMNDEEEVIVSSYLHVDKVADPNLVENDTPEIDLDAYYFEQMMETSQEVDESTLHTVVVGHHVEKSVDESVIEL